MKVVLIKSESDGPDKFVKELQKNNFNVTSIPSIDFRFKNLENLCDTLKNHLNYEGMIFTSPRAVYAVKNAAEQVDFLHDWISKEYNYTVGETTSMLAENLLNIKTKGKEAGNALKLSKVIINDFEISRNKKKLLFACGNLRQDTLEKSLKEHSIELDTIEVYETIQHPNLEDSIKNLCDVEFIVFFSPSSVKFSLPHFEKHQINLNETKIIAIGPSTEKCLTNSNIKCYGVCTEPSPESLLHVLKQY